MRKTSIIEGFLDEVDRTIMTIPDEEDIALGGLRAEVPLVRTELAALKEENERLKEATSRLLRLALLVGYVEDGRYNMRGGCLIHQDQIRECAKAIEAAQAALEKVR